MTRRDLIKKWAVYAVCAVVLTLVQAQALTHLTLWGVHPFLLPAIAVLPAAFERNEGAVLFAVFYGLVCDLLMPVAGLPCFYELAFFAAALASWVLSARVVTAGLFCSLTVTAASLLLCGLLHLLVLSAAGESMTAALGLLVREALLTLPLTPLVHFPYRKVRQLTQFA